MARKLTREGHARHGLQIVSVEGSGSGRRPRTLRRSSSGCSTSVSVGSAGNSNGNTNVPAGNLPLKGAPPTAPAPALGSPCLRFHIVAFIVKVGGLSMSITLSDFKVNWRGPPS